MATKFHKSIYIPRNRAKYIGNKAICCRSSWERSCCIFFDNHPAIQSWASEPFSISYTFMGKTHKYFPDFFIVYTDKNGNTVKALLEVKPYSQTGASLKKSRSSAINFQIAKNSAKWTSAKMFCSSRGIVFSVISERELFGKL